MNKDCETLKDLFLTCPETGEDMEIEEYEETDDNGNIVIYTKGFDAKWKHTIVSERIK